MKTAGQMEIEPTGQPCPQGILNPAERQMVFLDRLQAIVHHNPPRKSESLMSGKLNQHTTEIIEEIEAEKEPLVTAPDEIDTHFQVRPAADGSISPSSVNGTLRMLILEDVVDDAKLVEEELRRGGIVFRSERVDTKSAFLQKIGDFKPDIILADFALPQFTALDALRLLRERGSDIPLVLVTGSQSEEVAVECMRAGAADYVLKMGLKRLPTALLNALAKKRAEREKEKATAALKLEFAAHVRTEQDLQKTRDRLETLSHRLLEVQEAERRVIARELHDEIGQALTAIKINLQAIARDGDKESRAAHVLESVEIVDQAVVQVRNLSLDLRPSILDDLGIVAATRWYLDRVARRSGFSTNFAAAGIDSRLGTDLETTCFRVAQEALTNIVRHAHASHVDVELKKDGSSLFLIIRDNGVGFNVENARENAIHGASLGILGMQERVSLSGGMLVFNSMDDHGTEIMAHFPCPTVQ